MKNKLMMVAVLLSALSLGACIDDNESQSVTNVRNSKTAELKSIAAMEKAAADAREALAMAEASLNAAEAKAQLAIAAKAQAQADMEKKQAELIELQKKAQELTNEGERLENEKKQAVLNQELEALKVTLKENEKKLLQVAGEIERAELANQKALAVAQLELRKAEAQLLKDNTALEQAKTDAERQKIIAEREKLQQRSTAYRTAVNNLITAKQALNNLKTGLVQSETGLATLEESKKASIAANNVTIAQKKAEIEHYKKYGNYMNEKDAATLFAKMNELSLEYNKLNDINNAKWQAFWSMEVNTDAVGSADEKIQEDDFYLFVYNNGYLSAEVKYEDGNIGTVSDNTLGGFVPYAYFRTQGKYYYYAPESEDRYYWRTALGDSAIVDCSELTADIRKVELAVSTGLQNYNDNLAHYKRMLASSQSQYNGEPMQYVWDPDTESYVEQKLNQPNAVDNTIAKKKLFDEATDEALKAQYKAEYEQAVEAENSMKGNISYYKRLVVDYTKRIELLNAGWKMYKEYAVNAKAMQDKLDARNLASVEAYKAQLAAWKEYIDANWNYNKVYTEYTVLRNLYYGYTQAANPEAGTTEWVDGVVDVASKIAYLENSIATLEKANADISAITTLEALIADQKARIAAQQVVVDTADKAVTIAKAALDEVMKEEGE